MIEAQHVCFASRDKSVTRNRLVLLTLWKVSSKKKRKRSCPFSSAKKAPKRKTSKVFNKEWVEALAASDKGSYFEKDKLLLFIKEERSFINQHVITFHIV